LHASTGDLHPHTLEYTCTCIGATLKPNKEEPKHIRFTVGGNRIDYKGNVSTPTTSLANDCQMPGEQYCQHPRRTIHDSLHQRFLSEEHTNEQAGVNIWHDSYQPRTSHQLPPSCSHNHTNFKTRSTMGGTAVMYMIPTPCWRSDFQF
jgi:hypothetical protein